MELLMEWMSFLTRWLHVMAGITWIGTSFYFNWFDANVRPARNPVVKENVRGTVEEIHGGGFYYHELYWPNRHPERLLVHAWPAKTTFYTGLVLMLLIYWIGASTYLVDPRVAELSGQAAVAISIGSIILGWLIYTTACRIFDNEAYVLMCVALLVVVAAYGFTHVFSGRGAFISMGAMLGSLMGLNVIRHIVPNHIAMRRQLNQGEPLDTHHGFLAKRRSQHNNYFTIPVVFCMVSNHFSAVYNHHLSWIILCLVLFAGWGVRHILNVQYKLEKRAVGTAVATGLSLVAALVVSFVPAPSTGALSAVTPRVIDDAGAMRLVAQHCAVCHAAKPSYPGFSAAPQGLALETREQVLQNRQRVMQQTFVAMAMPLGNVTQMSDQERADLKLWLESVK